MAFEPFILTEVAALPAERAASELGSHVLVGTIPAEGADGRWAFHTRRSFKPPPAALLSARLTLEMHCWPLKRPSMLRSVIRAGRAPSNDVVLDAESVSKLHAELRIDGASVLLKDLGSANGTFVRGARLSGQPEKVESGDDVGFGTVVLRFMATPVLLALLLPG